MAVGEPVHEVEKANNGNRVVQRLLIPTGSEHGLRVGRDEAARRQGQLANIGHQRKPFCLQTRALEIVHHACQQVGVHAELLCGHGMHAMTIPAVVQSGNVGGNQLALTGGEARRLTHDVGMQLDERASGSLVQRHGVPDSRIAR